MAELARYQVRTPPLLWLGRALIAGACAFGIGALVIFDRPVTEMLVVLAPLCGAAFVFWFAMPEYHIGAGRHLIRIYADRIEVPAMRERKPIVFPRDGLELRIDAVNAKYRFGLLPLGTIERGKLLQFRHGSRSRKLSTLVLADRGDERALLADLQRFMAGEPALGRAAHDVPAPRTEYDDRIDRELAGLD